MIASAYNTAVDLTELARVTVALNNEIEKRIGERTLTTKTRVYSDGCCSYCGDNPSFNLLIKPTCNYKALEAYIINHYISK